MYVFYCLCNLLFLDDHGWYDKSGKLYFVDKPRDIIKYMHMRVRSVARLFLSVVPGLKAEQLLT